MANNVKQILMYFGLTIPISLIFWIPMILINWGIISIPIPIIIFSSLGALSPLISLYIIEKIYWKAVPQPKLFKIIFQRISFKKKDIFSLIISALIIPFIYVLSSLANFLFGFQSGIQILNSGPDNLGWALIIIIPITFFAMLLTSPLFEEPGWRGFAIIELDKIMPRFFSSLIIGTYWWLWHQGMNIANNDWPSLFGYFSMVFDSFLIDALFRKSGYNLLIAMFAHSAYFVAITYFYSIPQNYLKLIIMIVLIIFIYLIPKPLTISSNGAHCIKNKDENIG
jgi:membrane protease YdiL (CAAX protease family)